MNFLKRGFKAAKTFVFGDEDEDEYSDGSNGGFSTKREVAVERRRIPVVQYAVSSLTGAHMGGIQSLSWFTRSMFRDDDGDVAEQFIDGEAGETKVGECAGDEDEARAGKVSYREARVEVERVLDGNVLLKNSFDEVQMD
ncbi:predicted protein [Micromonas commoda]|uniref:Uncharacterized protein n=1 Tax=Micromonas commoda (strain RCC299 / NOUM17 / CCMP2709) TaxID=296587 RepID=C1EAN2_MICCC|nr:predicted protein [Micromonas commoda]ACO64889.1 predicted protein [Micromonas commoda]|eukprot:XP_002503631.1 predicted protein [Micromonas commoda]